MPPKAIPRFREPKGLVIRFARELQARLGEVLRQTRIVIVDDPRWRDLTERARQERGVADEVRADDEFDELAGALDAIKIRVDREQPKEVIVDMLERYGEEVNRDNVSQFKKQYRAALGVDTVGSAPRGPTILRSYVKDNVSLIKTIEQTKIANVGQIIERGWRKGERWETMRDEIVKKTGTTFEGATRIARDQVGKLNAELSRDRALAAGVDKFKWRTSQDGRVRAMHRRLDGKVYTYKKGHPSEGLPGWAISCFPGDTPVTFVGWPDRLFRRNYVGDLIEIHLGDRVIRATPNHPIATMHGWVAAEQIQIGDEIIEVPQMRNGPGHNYGKQPTFSQLWEFGKVTRSHGLVTADFHGDAGVDDHVDVVDADRGLLFDIVTAFPQAIGCLMFTDSDQALLSHRRKTLQNHGNLHPARGIVGRFGPRVALLGRSVAHALEHAVAPTTDFDPACGEPPSEDGPLVSGADADRLEGFTVDVGPRKVVDVRRDRGWSGHVYNLESSTGIYVADGIIVHNCRCTAEPVFDELEAESLAPEWEQPETPPGFARTSGGRRPRPHIGPALPPAPVAPRRPPVLVDPSVVEMAEQAARSAVRRVREAMAADRKGAPQEALRATLEAARDTLRSLRQLPEAIRSNSRVAAAIDALARVLA